MNGRREDIEGLGKVRRETVRKGSNVEVSVILSLVLRLLKEVWEDWDRSQRLLSIADRKVAQQEARQRAEEEFDQEMKELDQRISDALSQGND